MNVKFALLIDIGNYKNIKVFVNQLIYSMKYM